MKKKILFTALAALALLTAQCGDNASKSFRVTYDKPETIAYILVPALIRNETATVNNLLITKREYIEKIHPHTPEANQGKGSISGEDKWNIFTGLHRGNAVLIKTSQYKDFADKKIVSITTEESNNILKYGPYKLHRKIMINIKFDDGTEHKDDELLGAVIEYKGRFALLNVFRD